MINGMRVVVSAMAIERGERVKRYPRRKAKSPSHWLRMDKKWRKRYGYHNKPCMYQLGADVLAVHPALYPQLLELVKQQETGR